MSRLINRRGGGYQDCKQPPSSLCLLLLLDVMRRRRRRQRRRRTSDDDDAPPPRRRRTPPTTTTNNTADDYALSANDTPRNLRGQLKEDTAQPIAQPEEGRQRLANAPKNEPTKTAEEEEAAQIYNSCVSCCGVCCCHVLLHFPYYNSTKTVFKL